MNERIQEIISLLLEIPDIKVTEMMDKLALTRRQVNYAIGLINEDLKAHGLSPIKRHNNGTFTYTDKLQELLVVDKNSNNNFPNKNRAELILLYLICNVDYVSLDDLTAIVHYSKTTILQDLKIAEQMVNKFHLNLKYNRSRGYFLQGSEDQILRLTTNIILQSSDNLAGNLLEKFAINKEIVKISLNLITRFEAKFQVSFSDKYFNNLKLLVQIIISRGLVCKSGLKVDEFIAKTKEYQYLRKLTELSNISDFYLKWIALEILSSNVFDKNNSEYSPDEIELFGFVHQIVEGFKSRTLVNIQDQSRFKKRLLNHLRPACFRVKYRLPSIETLNLDNDKDEQLLVDIIKDLIKPLEQWIGTKFSEDEVKLLTYYFGYLLFDNTNSQKINNAKYSAVVVCSNGIIMSNILIKILKNIFPEISFLGTMSSREFSESDHDFNIVFSNMPLKTKLRNYIVKPNMTSSEKTTLRYRVLKDLGLEKVDYQLNALLNLIAKYTKVDDEAKLRNEIISILLSDSEKNDRKSEDTGKLPNLLSYIKEKYIKVISSKKTDWKDALYQALEPLIEDNKVEDQYYFELVDQISNRYNYSFLGQDMAIPHAVPEKGIKDDGISLLISHYPIKLPYGKKVRIIAPIAFFHMDRYLNAINQLANLSTNDREINKLLNTNTSEQAFTILKEYVERGD